MLRGDGTKQATASLKILGPLGAGGFGAVYEALDTRSGQRVAVKELDDTSADSIARFKHEFRALANCHHVNLVGLRELIEQDGRWLIVMELVPGTDFLRYVQRDAVDEPDNDTQSGDAAPLYDEVRLRGALIGMVEGLRALHGFGIVHRDLKPSNVRVRPDGRAVLLDFGLATSVDPKQQSTHAMGVGTVVYMAPEQAGGESLGPSVDLYALGVCLFEALTGRAPFEGGHALTILLNKQRIEAPRAQSLAPCVPADLDALCARLLAIDPAARPSLDEVRSVLTRAPVASSLMPAHAAPAEEAFAGRDAELSHLERALARTHESELRLVLVEGESGVGKSELVSEFLRRAYARYPKLVALRGRCYESEQVSYKAFDGCIDELAKLLRRIPDSECAALLPERALLLGQLFPVLRNVKSIAKAAREGSSADPSARRLEAFSALSHLLSKLAEERPVVLVLDDLQWADTESFRLLSALNQQAVRAPILLLGTVRPRSELEPDVRAQLEEVRGWQHTDVVPLSGLPREQAKALARKLLGPSAPDAWLGMIADESQGHPLFMSELVQYTQSHDFAARETLTLEAALRSRVDRLDRGARELLELVALAARPYPATVFANALGSNIDESARSLLASKLLRQRKGGELSCYHDRIRHAAVDLIARARLPALHYQLAAAVDALPEADVSEQARHWDLAGQPERACSAYERAATNALGALAFTRAAGLCARAIELLAGAVDERVQRLTIQRADALACAGQSGQAAELYQQAADGAHGEARILLRSRVAKHLMLNAQLARGFAVARELLIELGFSLPRNTTLALLRYSWDSLCIAFAGVDNHKTAHKVDARECLALDVVDELSNAVAGSHLVAGAVLAAQYVRRAARSGTALHVALGVAMYAWLRTLQSSLVSAEPLLAKAKQLGQGLEGHPHMLARHLHMIGTTHAAGLDWAGAREYLESAQRIAQERCADDPWLLTCCRYQLGGAWYFLGQHGKLAAESERWLSEARERNDAMGVAWLVGMGYGFVRHLLRDQPAMALAEIEQAGVAIADSPYSFPHLGQLIASVVCHLYRSGPGALRYLDAHEAKHTRAFLLRTNTGKQARWTLRLLALLSAACGATQEGERRAFLVQAKRLAHNLRSSRSMLTRAYHALACAQIEAIEGSHEHALSLARDASARFRALSHVGQRAGLYVEGLLEGGASGAEKCESALAQVRAEGWREPLRSIAGLAPLHPLLVPKREKPASPRAKTLLLDRYEVLGQLGRGGFGAVVSARDVRSGRTVALKELVRSGGMPLERFKQEFRALSDLHHEHIVQLDALFEHDGSWFIAMELVEGIDLVSYVRASGSCDGQRLRSTFAGLSRALSALHAKGFVHRDVKPENVIVTSEGRAVLIDFGLIARAGDEREAGPVGSAECAPPEQLLGALPAASADVYALGSCLHAALTGRPPYVFVSQAQLFADKQRAAAEVPALPGLEDVARLCQRMLQESPELRPNLLMVAAELTADAHGPGASAAPAPSRVVPEDAQREAGFAGRERELLQLQQSYQRTRESGFALVLIEGESGLGKSALVHDFASRRQRSAATLQLLTSRCYENEQVAFKAFDGAVDQLARMLRSLPETQCEALLPKRAALLAQLFPVLSSVSAIASAPKKGLPADPAARKQAGLECFLQLLESLAARCPLLLTIDDLQWADSESFGLLRALAKRGESIPLMVLCTVRPSAELEAEVVAELDSLRSLPRTEVVLLSALDSDASMELARQLLGVHLDVARLSALVRESKGHPLFLRELVLHEASASSARAEGLTLEAALSARMAGLSADARELLTLVALADKPYGVHVYAGAMGRPELPRDALVLLLDQGFLQRRGDQLSCYHDRIRRVTTGHLEGEQRARYAGALAAALSRDPHTDAAERARLWDEAEDSERAMEAYEQAGDQALETLAFVRAEMHYARALALLGDKPGEPRWQRLLVARGHALVRAGRSAEAARVYERAAEQAAGEEKVRLRIWASQHLIQSAQVDEGMRAATLLLGELGISLPPSEGAAKARIAWERTRVKLRGIALSKRQSSAHERLVLEALHGLSAPVRAVSYLPGSALVVQYLRRALNAGDPRHAARALAYEGLWRSVRSPTLGQEALFEQSRALAQATSEPALIAEVDLTQGLALMGRNQPKAASVYLARANELLQSQCPGQPWLLTASRMYLGSAWNAVRNFPELRRQAGAWVEEARARDDRYAVAALSGFGAASFRYALDDDPEAGLAEIEQAMAPWPDEPFTTTHLGAFLTASQILAVCEQAPRYLRYLDDRRPQLERAFLLRAPGLRFWLLYRRIQALLQGIDAPNRADASELVARAKVEQRALARLAVPDATGAAHYVDGWLCLLAGEREQALVSLQRAHALLKESSGSYVSGMQYTLGVVEGGEKGRAICETARAQIEAEGWRSWRRGLSMRLPGSLHLLESG